MGVTISTMLPESGRATCAGARKSDDFT